MYMDKSIYIEKALFRRLPLLPPLRSDSERQPVMSMITWPGLRRRRRRVSLCSLLRCWSWIIGNIYQAKLPTTLIIVIIIYRNNDYTLGRDIIFLGW